MHTTPGPAWRGEAWHGGSGHGKVFIYFSIEELMSTAIVHESLIDALLHDDPLFTVIVQVGTETLTLDVTAKTEHQAQQAALSHVTKVAKVSQRERQAMIRSALEKARTPEAPGGSGDTLL